MNTCSTERREHFRVGDLEQLPCPHDSFGAVADINAFQFADEKARALADARRVSSAIRARPDNCASSQCIVAARVRSRVSTP
jgi:hypothetical protein